MKAIQEERKKVYKEESTEMVKRGAKKALGSNLGKRVQCDKKY